MMNELAEVTVVKLVDDSYDARGWGEEQPAVLDVRSWAVANHVLDVIIKAIST